MTTTRKWYLVVDLGIHKGTVVAVNAAEYWIGRGRTCQLRPVADTVSRRHCVLLLRGDAMFVVDYRTPNGTYVNGRRIGKEVELHEGDHLQVGPLNFRVRRAGEAVQADCPVGGGLDEDAVAQMLLSMEGPISEPPASDEGPLPATPTEGIALGMNDTHHDQKQLATRPSDPASTRQEPIHTGKLR